MPSAERTEGWVSAPAPDRAADIHAAFLDPEVAVVLAAIGGNHSNQLLPHLDYELIREHPKVFQGYSDVTVLLWALFAHAGLRTFHGPALVPELGEFPSVLDYTDRSLRAAWLGAEQLRFEPVESWTDELLNWNVRADLTRPRELRPASGWATVRGGAAEGPLVGGSLEAIWWHLKGSDCWVDPAGAILFLETSELAYPPSMYDSALTDLENPRGLRRGGRARLRPPLRVRRGGEGAPLAGPARADGGRRHPGAGGRGPGPRRPDAHAAARLPGAPRRRGGLPRTARARDGGLGA